MHHKIINTLTGLCGFISWFYLVNKTPEQAINLALGVLLMLIGFGGRDTIIEIIKSWKE